MTRNEARGNLIYAIRWNDMPTKEALEIAIKDLEQQTCEDAVSREAVLDIFADNADATRPYSTAWEKIRDLPPVNPQSKIGWIPVSERLPEQYKEVIVTDIETTGTYLSRYIGNGHWECDNGLFDNRIIAWMPLPKKYELQESEE